MSPLNKVLHGCNLQTGTLLLLWLFAIFCGFSVVLDIYHMSKGAQPLSDAEEISWISFEFIVAFLYKLGVFTVAIIGLYGIHRNKPQFFIIFYYFNYIQLLLISFFIVYLFLDPVEHSKNLVPGTKLSVEDQNRTVILTLLLVLALAFQIYFTLVVKTYYEAMKELSLSKTSIILFTYPEHYNYGLTYVR